MSRRASFLPCKTLLALATASALGACGGSSSSDDDGDDDTTVADAAVVIADDGAIVPAPDAPPPGTPDATTGPDADTSGLAHFSFFVTSLAALQDLSGNDQGFGGDLRYGETGAGAGLRGADKLCAAIAERSMPGASAKTWRAFLSVTDDGTGHQVNAIDRIGDGPWYDRLGRLLAPSKADLMFTRPQNGDATIQNDFPNEDGVPNHKPDTTQAAVDNHDMLTGSTTSGTLYSATATCLDWTGGTGSSAEGKPRVGHSWPRSGGGGGPGGGDMNSWMSSLTESGCAPGVSLVEMGPPDPNSNTVGSGGGYGGFYCFALVP
jgi:hypothetical protein